LLLVSGDDVANSEQRHIHFSTSIVTVVDSRWNVVSRPDDVTAGTKTLGVVQSRRSLLSSRTFTDVRPSYWKQAR
jgi:hypothetical protein